LLQLEQQGGANLYSSWDEARRSRAKAFQNVQKRKAGNVKKRAFGFVLQEDHTDWVRMALPLTLPQAGGDSTHIIVAGPPNTGKTTAMCQFFTTANALQDPPAGLHEQREMLLWGDKLFGELLKDPTDFETDSHCASNLSAVFHYLDVETGELPDSVKVVPPSEYEDSMEVWRRLKPSSTTLSQLTADDADNGKFFQNEDVLRWFATGKARADGQLTFIHHEQADMARFQNPTKDFVAFMELKSDFGFKTWVFTLSNNFVGDADALHKLVGDPRLPLVDKQHEPLRAKTWAHQFVADMGGGEKGQQAFEDVFGGIQELSKDYRQFWYLSNAVGTEDSVEDRIMKSCFLLDEDVGKAAATSLLKAKTEDGNKLANVLRQVLAPPPDGDAQEGDVDTQGAGNDGSDSDNFLCTSDDEGSVMGDIRDDIAVAKMQKADAALEAAVRQDAESDKAAEQKAAEDAVEREAAAVRAAAEAEREAAAARAVTEAAEAAEAADAVAEAAEAASRVAAASAAQAVAHAKVAQQAAAKKRDAGQAGLDGAGAGTSKSFQ
jgi:hypothetical protein